MGKSETEASMKAFEKMKKQGQEEPPPLVSDGWGGIRDALVEVYGEVPAYQGRGRPPTKKQAQSQWQYLQIVKQRDSKGRLIGIKPKAIFGEEQDLIEIFGSHTAYIERSHLSMRHANCRLTRKSLNFSKDLQSHEAAALFDDAVYNFVRPLKTLRLDTKPNAKRFEQRYQHRTPAMAAGLSDHIWSLDEFLRSVVVPDNS